MASKILTSPIQSVAQEKLVTTAFTRKVSFFKSGIYQAEPTSSITPKTAGLLVKYGFKVRTNLLRSLLQGSEEQKKCKLQLPYVTPAGTFSKRANAAVLTHSGYMVLDFDKLNSLESPRKLRRRLLKDRKLSPSIVLAYISPRGYGLKVWVAVDPSLDYKGCYEAVVAHVKAKHPNWCKDEKLDITTDISRGCLLCHDPTVFIREDYATAPAFPLPVESLAALFDDTGDRATLTNTRSVDSGNIDRWVTAAEQVTDFADNYHVWFRLGMAFTTLGEPGRAYFHRLSKTSAAKYQPKECDRVFDSWAQHNNGRISMGTFFYLCQQAGIAPEGTEELSAEIFAGTPCFAASTFQLLPEPLREICGHFSLERERDIAFTGLTGVLGGCFPTVKGTYRRKTIQANQYVFITGNSATGKGTMEVSRELLWPYHKKLKAKQAEYDAAKKAYDRQVEAYERAVLAGKQPAVEPTPPVAPAMGQLFGGADNSVANVVKTMAENAGRLIIFETEADGITNSFKQDIGNYSPLLRKGSEHEPYLYERKTAGKYELDYPALSVILSGTPQQVRPLIQSVENGLFSRFWFYAYFLPHTFDDPFAEEGSALEECLQRLAVYVEGMIEWVAQYSITVKLTPDQQQRFREAWTTWLAKGIADFGEGSGSALKRQGRACFRLCMLFTVLRNYKPGQPLSDTLECSDDDFNAALQIADVLRQHTLIVYQSLAPRTREVQGTIGNQKKAAEDIRITELFLQGISARQIAKDLDMPHMTVVGRIKKLGLRR